MFRFSSLVFIVVVLVGLVSPESASAQGFVTCEGPDCNYCDLVEMGSTLLSWLIQLAVIFATIILAVAGVRVAAARSNPQALSQAKDSLFNIIIGIFVVAIAFTLIDTLLKTLVGGQYGPWNELTAGTQCGGQRQVGTPDVINIDGEDFVVEALEAEDSTMTVFNTSYQTQYGSSGGSSGFVPAGLGGVPPQQAGQLCYANGTCLPAVNISGQPGYEYPLCGFDINTFVDVGRHGGQRISKYFTLSDLAAPKSKQAYGPYVYVDPQLPPIMDALREEIGSFQVTSGYRSPGYNRSLGSSNSGVASCSRHMSGLAVDIIPGGGVSQSQVAQACQRLGARYTNPDYNVHTHCDWGHLTGRVQGYTNSNSAGPQ